MPRALAPRLALTALTMLATTTFARADGAGTIPELFESSFANEATGDLDRALNDVLNILRVDDGHYLGNLRAGWLYYSKGRYDDAVRFYDKAGKGVPKAIEPRLGQMLPLMAAKRWKEAEALGLAVLRRAPHNYLASSRLAYITFSLGRYKDAETYYRAVLDDYPSDTEMMLGLGWTYLRQGRKAEARAMFEAVLSIRRQNVNARAGLDSL